MRKPTLTAFLPLMILTLVFVFSSVITGSRALAQSTAPVCAHPYIFFDLGETLIDTTTNKYNPMFLMTGASDYLNALKAKGYKIGLISDVPAAWGRDKDDVTSISDYPTAKWQRLIEFTRGVYSDDKNSWQGPVFDPSWFGDFENEGPALHFNGRVFLPMTDLERKKSGSVVLFERALKAAQAEGCDAIYMGEDAFETDAAARTGLVSFQVGRTMTDSFYLPLERIESYVASHRFVPSKFRSAQQR